MRHSRDHFLIDAFGPRVSMLALKRSARNHAALGVLNTANQPCSLHDFAENSD